MLLLLSYNYYSSLLLLKIFCRAAVSVKISKELICFYSFELSCTILEKDNFIEHLCIVLFFFNLFDLYIIVCYRNSSKLL